MSLFILIVIHIYLILSTNFFWTDHIEALPKFISGSATGCVKLFFFQHVFYKKYFGDQEKKLK